MTNHFKLACGSVALVFFFVAASPLHADKVKEGDADKGSPTAAQSAGREPKKEEIVASDELVDRGRALFTGERHFSKRGATCVSCHAIRYQGVRGGNWGPGLTQMYTTMGEEGMQAVLKGPPFAGRKKMYEEKPLTEDEIKALAAFAKDAASRREEAAPHFFPWAGIVFFFIIMGIFSLYKRRIR